MSTELERMTAPEPVVNEVEVYAGVDAAVAGLAVAQQPWQIESVGAADWAMRKLAELRHLEMGYTDEIDRWEDALRRARRASEWFEERLQEWGVAERGARATFVLANGTVATRKSAARVVVVSEPDAIEWARTNCVAALKITTVEKFLVSQLGESTKIVRGADGDWRVVDANGELVPGLGVVPEHISASVQPDLG